MLSTDLFMRIAATLMALLSADNVLSVFTALASLNMVGSYCLATRVRIRSAQRLWAPMFSGLATLICWIIVAWKLASSDGPRLW